MIVFDALLILLHAGGSGRLSMTRWDLQGVHHFDFDIGAKSISLTGNWNPTGASKQVSIIHPFLTEPSPHVGLCFLADSESCHSCTVSNTYHVLVLFGLPSARMHL